MVVVKLETTYNYIAILHEFNFSTYKRVLFQPPECSFPLGVHLNAILHGSYGDGSAYDANEC
jgi:hypothetical protein